MFQEYHPQQLFSPNSHQHHCSYSHCYGFLYHTSIQSIQKKYNGKFKIFLDATNELGNIRYTLPASAAITGISLNTKDEKFQDAAFTSLSSLIISDGMVTFLKVLIGRSRPDDGNGPYHFRPLSGKVSFPSGHAASAFALLTPWIIYYPNVFTYFLFALPVGTGLARMAKKRHWASDVITGSIIGFGVSYLLTKWHKQKYKEEKGIDLDDNRVFNINFVIPI